MKVGDIIKASWSDGLVVTGSFLKEDKGYIILSGEGLKNIVCNPRCVKFEIVNEKK